MTAVRMWGQVLICIAAFILGDHASLGRDFLRLVACSDDASEQQVCPDTCMRCMGKCVKKQSKGMERIGNSKGGRFTELVRSRHGNLTRDDGLGIVCKDSPDGSRKAWSWVFYAEHVLFPRCELAELFASHVPSQSLWVQDEGVDVTWFSGVDKEVELFMEKPKRKKQKGDVVRHFDLPLMVANRSQWRILLETSTDDPSDWWQMTFRRGFFSNEGPVVTLSQIIGYAFVLPYVGYLRWAQLIIATIISENNEAMGGNMPVAFADLACGSGWMGTVVAANVPNVNVHFSDIENGVYENVHQNIRLNNLAQRASFSTGDLFAAYNTSLKGKFDHIFFYPPQSYGTELDHGIAASSYLSEDASRLDFFKRVEASFAEWLRPNDGSRHQAMAGGGSLWMGADMALGQDVLTLFKQRKDCHINVWHFDFTPAFLLRIRLRRADEL